MSNKQKYEKDPRGPHIRIYHQVFDSPAFGCLSAIDLVAYMALRRDLTNTNNGDLSLTLSKAKERGISHHLTLARSLRALCAVGLIVLTRKGGASRGGQRLPSLYGVTDQEIYEMRHKQIEARKAGFEFRKVTSVEHGRALIEAAEASAKAAAKIKNPRTPDDSY